MKFLPGMSRSQIQNQAYRIGVKLTKGVYWDTVHAAAAEYMRQHNPSRLPGARERMSKQSNNPEGIERLLRGHAKMRKDKPSKLEERLGNMLRELGVKYEAQVLIKPKFIVDFLIGGLIIEADGDWWHGHPRFEPLLDRQIRQKSRDAARNAYLTRVGYQVVRIWESDLTIDWLREVIDDNRDIIGSEVKRRDPPAVS
jgi:very-short-patch-repair endonuclease